MLPSAPMQNIERNVHAVRERIHAAALGAGRVAADIELLGVSKTRPLSQLLEATDAGLTSLGESRVQEAEDKIHRMAGPVRWHLIGKLQTNKARLAAALFDVVHSVDRADLVERLEAAACGLERSIDVYVQVDFVRTERSDAAIDQLAADLCRRVHATTALRLVGLMTLPPFGPTPESARPYFQRLRELRDQIVAGTGMPPLGLSMGMTNDFEVAIDEGATIVRVGTAIFGPRT